MMWRTANTMQATVGTCCLHEHAILLSAALLLADCTVLLLLLSVLALPLLPQ
jgi:hypothetical protein